MSWRTRSRGALPYVIAALAGFVLAYLIVAFFVFPAGIVPRDSKVPNVTGMSVADAETRLKRAGLLIQQGETRVSATVPKGTIMEQSPRAGAVALQGATVTVTVSGGAEVAVIPMVNGMTRSGAEASLENAGFTVGEVSEEPDSSPRGTVVRSQPAGGSRATLPGPVGLVLSAGPASVAVPDVVGRSLDEARQLLAQVGLRVARTTYDGGAMAPTGTIVGQSPAPGASIIGGGDVTLTVAGTP